MTTVLLFGPQALSFRQKSIDQLYFQLHRSADCRWILRAISELPAHWETITDAVPGLGSIPAPRLLEALDEWARNGTLKNTSFPLPSVLLTPLVVIAELCQYWQHLESKVQSTQADWLLDLHSAFGDNAETLGFCTGLLSALVVSCSANKAKFQKYGAAAIRLAMLIGGLVDAEDAGKGGESKSFSTQWTSPENEVEMRKTLERYTETYISVLYDERRATVTTPKSTYQSLVEELRSIGISTYDVSLRGRFHCQKHSKYNLKTIFNFCDSHKAFQLPDASSLVLPTRSNVNGEYIENGKLHQFALESILVEQLNWYGVFSSLMSSRLSDDNAQILSFGPERCVPPSLARKLGDKLLFSSDFDQQGPQPALGSSSDNDIAVIGMSLKTAGAEDLEGFWKILCEGKSQHVEVPDDRFTFDSSFREKDPKRKWYGNFIKDVDTFDHKFFKKSPREMASADPQQRMMLQAAYQAVEQSGYFQQSSPNKHIGCYIGVGTVDYETNIACYPANAYSATGNLKSFVAGKISHHFGWTGPGLTIDTACSASAVAVHTACKAILGGDCTAAIAGGATIITDPKWFQNLAGASFLSPTGACKPFDAKADGYCRGEGVGAVFLKRKSAAIADGDQIIGIIGGSAVYQNQNCTPITVPNAGSLSDLFRDVAQQARIKPEQISVVEAHGTGTPVGDPAEYDGVRRVLAGSNRSDVLSIGSVKGLVGHTECASGIVALVKTLLMTQEATIPPQASHETMNPGIGATPSDNMEVTTRLKPWQKDFRAALINNYGASGSNASMVVTQAPGNNMSPQKHAIHQTVAKHPFWFCGYDDSSLKAYVKRFLAFIRSKTVSCSNMSVSNLAFNLARQSNRSLGRALIFNCSSVEELEEKLTAFDASAKTLDVVEVAAPKPVIMCFGGQVSTFIGLDRQVYESCKILRKHLDDVNAACQSVGLEGIYPDIFQREPIKDTVKFQTALFASQYASAKSWIDCGIEVAATVGHSFGELTSLCVTGALSLQDTVKMISSRARLVRDSWGSEKGSMMAIEGNLEDVSKLLSESSKACPGEQPASIACFNGPKSFTLAGSGKAIEAVEETKSKIAAYSSMRAKKLNVSNSFHCSLVEPIMADLKRVGEELTFTDPIIPIERATEEESTGRFSTSFVADHMRNPVFFNHAVQRLAKRYPSAIWLEAGSNSTITTMASRALGSATSSHFAAVNITTDRSLQKLADTTIGLWKEGLNVAWWPHSREQTSEYPYLLLPPYQFEKTKHWMEWKKPPQPGAVQVATEPQTVEEMPKSLWTFVGYQDDKQKKARFRINTMIPAFEEYVSGHTIAQAAPLCPSTLQLDIAIEALRSLKPDFEEDYQPQSQFLDNLTPLCMDKSRMVWLDIESQDKTSHTWEWKMASHPPDEPYNVTVHVSGEIMFRSVHDPQLLSDFARYERLVGHKRCLELLDGKNADDVIQGRNIYKTFAEIVDYGEVYRGVQKIAGKGNESAGRVIKKYTGESWLDTPLADSFCQVAGIFVNCMTDRPDKDICISNRIEQWIRSPKLRSASSKPDSWDVFAYHYRPTEKSFISDVFIFDPRSGELMEMILGIAYQRIGKAGLGKMLLRLTPGAANNAPAPSASVVIEEPQAKKEVETLKPNKPAKPGKKNSTNTNLVDNVKTLVADISGVEIEELKDDAILADIGIDSLMAMELTREIEGAFKCTLDPTELYDVVDFKGLIKCIKNALSGGEENDESEDDSESDVESDAGSEKSTAATSIAGVETPPLKNNIIPQRNPSISSVTTSSGGLKMPASTVLEAFGETKKMTDDFIKEHKFADYHDHCLPKMTEMCVAHICEAFEKLGCSLKAAKPGQTLKRIQHIPKLDRLVEYLYMILEKEARLVDIDGSKITRTAVTPPTKSAETLLADLCRQYPDHTNDHKLTHLTGSKLAECLTGKSDGIQLIFGSKEGRELVSTLYGRSPINMVWLKQMEEFIRRLVSKLPMEDGPIKILEMGAGTGGTTAGMSELLASLNVPVEYTFTDLSPSLVAAARRRFKQHVFMKFHTHDIEKAPSPELVQSQHIVIANNCVHATHSLANSTRCIRDVLRPDGLLMMVEMTAPLYWVDMIFGLLEGWWLFDDGRRHAVQHQSVWERDMQSVGFGHVDYTEGHRPEANLQRILVAFASGPKQERLPLGPKSDKISHVVDAAARQGVIDGYVQRFTQGFIAPNRSGKGNNHQVLETPLSLPSSSEKCVLVTGATGSLGCHLVALFASLPDVSRVVCVNRRSREDDARSRQLDAFRSRGISMEGWLLAKLEILETDTTKPNLGLEENKYNQLTSRVTHIVHNAWPMTITRPIKGFEPQLQGMRNLIDFAVDIAARRPTGQRVGFEFISSIATVGLHPLWSGETYVPEQKMSSRSILSSGYSEAKLVCEHMLEETLSRHPESFRAFSVRIGQIAGSKASGYWNPVEHFSFLVKSAQVLKALPDLRGELSWCPVNDVAAALSELLVVSPDGDSNSSCPLYYHIENPSHQSWPDMIHTLADELEVDREEDIVPFDEWLRRVRQFPGAADIDNPALRVVDFLADNFLRMSCGGLWLDTTRSREHSKTLAAMRPVDVETVRKYVRSWKDIGFLHP